jgi:SAM-dependent methyltransferase
MRDICYEMYCKYFGKMNLNIGSANNHEKEKNGQCWINLDMNPEVKPDVVHSLYDLPLPFEDNTFDSVLGSHIFEHVHKEKFLPLVADIHRILKPGGYLLAFTPYGTSFDSWENPHHVQNFTESTWVYVMDDIYCRDDAGNGANQMQPTNKWQIANITLVPMPEFKDDPEIEWKRRHLNNVISEVHCIMRTVK